MRVDLEAELVGESGLLDDLPQPLTWRHAWIGDLSKCGQSKFHTDTSDEIRTHTVNVGVARRIDSQVASLPRH